MATWPAKTNYATGDVLSATNMNDIGNGLNDLYGESFTNNFYAGKNKIINGDFGINQRNFTSNTTNLTYMFDRWTGRVSGDGTATYTPQVFTPGTAPVAGYEGTNFFRVVTASQTTTAVRTTFRQLVEDVRTFAGQTVTLSFWAKAASGTPKIAGLLNQNFGTGGSTGVDIPMGTVTISTSWARYSITIAIPSISGKTIGTGSLLLVDLGVSAGSDFNTAYSSIGIQNNTFDIWGVQLEAGSIATPFQTATGTKQGELAACQRYYFRTTYNTSGDTYGLGVGTAATTAEIGTVNPVYMRIAPTSVDYSNLRISDRGGSDLTVTNLTINSASTSYVRLNITVASGVTAAKPYFLIGSASAGYLGFSAEL